MKTLKEWFGLKDGRDNFKLKAREDAHLILCHDQDIREKVIGSIERRFAANEPIKMIIYGDWGVGKTHTANHIGWWLEHNKQHYPAKIVMQEVGDLKKTSRFDVLVRPFVEELGIDFLVDLTFEYQKKKGNTAKALREAGVSDYVASTFGKFNLAEKGSTPPPAVLEAFHVLQGRKPAPGYAAYGLGQQIIESKELYNVLFAIGEMYRTVHGHRLVFVADEAAQLEQVENDDTTKAHWVAVNREIFDDKNGTFGFIYTLTGKTNRLPEAIFDPQIQNRLGQSYLELRNLDKTDVEQYLVKLTAELVDSGKVKDMVAKGEIPKKDYDPACYPFSRAGYDRFVDFFQRSSENAKPRDISDRLDELGFIAIKSSKRLIDEDCLAKASM